MTTPRTIETAGGQIFAEVYLSVSTYMPLTASANLVQALDTLRLQMLREISNLHDWHSELEQATENDVVKQARKDVRMAMSGVTDCLVELLADKDDVVDHGQTKRHYHYEYDGNNTAMPLTFCTARV